MTGRGMPRLSSAVLSNRKSKGMPLVQTLPGCPWNMLSMVTLSVWIDQLWAGRRTFQQGTDGENGKRQRLLVECRNVFSQYVVEDFYDSHDSSHVASCVLVVGVCVW